MRAIFAGVCIFRMQIPASRVHQPAPDCKSNLNGTNWCVPRHRLERALIPASPAFWRARCTGTNLDTGFAASSNPSNGSPNRTV